MLNHLPPVITYKTLNDMLQLKKFDEFFELCNKIYEKNPTWLTPYIDKLIKNNIISGNIEFVEYVYKNIYKKDISIEYILECILDYINNENAESITNLFMIHNKKGNDEILNFILSTCDRMNIKININIE